MPHPISIQRNVLESTNGLSITHDVIATTNVEFLRHQIRRAGQELVGRYRRPSTLLAQVVVAQQQLLRSHIIFLAIDHTLFDTPAASSTAVQGEH